MTVTLSTISAVQFDSLMFLGVMKANLFVLNMYAMLVGKTEDLGCGAARTAPLLPMKIVYHVRSSQFSSTTGLGGLYAGDMLLM